MLESIVTAYKDFTQNKIPGIVETKMKLCGVLDVWSSWYSCPLHRLAANLDNCRMRHCPKRQVHSIKYHRGTLPRPLPRPLPPPLPPCFTLARNSDLSSFKPRGRMPRRSFPSWGSSLSSCFFEHLLGTNDISREPPGPNLTTSCLVKDCCCWRAATLSPSGRASSFTRDTWFMNASAWRSSLTSYNLQVQWFFFLNIFISPNSVSEKLS